ncbi:MAG: hypothetical protein IKR98_01580 [Bacteroidaceae bacterium]|nr:hypothetical protein [Bacteroidaceae bacterium]
MNLRIDMTSFVKFLLRLQGGLTLKDNVPLLETFESNRKRMFSAISGLSGDSGMTGGSEYALCGVSLATLNEWAHRRLGPSTTYTVEELQELPFHIWLEVVKTMFWEPLRCSEFYERPHLALAVVDYAFCSGVERAALTLQEVLNKMNAQSGSYTTRRKDDDGILRNIRIQIEEDGIIGRETLTAIQKVLRHATAEREAVRRICTLRSVFVCSLAEEDRISVKLRDVLLNRINMIEGTPRWAL